MKPKIVFNLTSQSGDKVVWVTDDGVLHAPYGFDGPGSGGEVPEDVMRKSTYDTNDSGVVDLAEGLTPGAKVDYSQLVNVPKFDINWGDIIDIPDDIVHRPELDIVVSDMDSKFTVMEGEISSRITSTEFEMKISEINGEINSVKEVKQEYYNSVDYYTADKTKVRLQSWFYQSEPHESSLPSSKWTTDEVRDSHLGDFYYEIESSKLYVYSKDIINNKYLWLEFTPGVSTDIVNPLVVHKVASTTIDTIEDNLRTSFRAEPTTPYKVGDLWKNGEVLMIAMYTRTEGEFNKDDWTVNYDTYDPSELESMIDELYGRVSSMYDTSNVLDTSWIWSINSGTPLSDDLMQMYAHNPEIRTNGSPYSTVMDNPNPFSSIDRLLRLTTASVATDGFNLGIRFGRSPEIGTMVQVDNSNIYRLSFWMKANSIQDLRVVVKDYNENGTEDPTNNAHQNRPLSYVNGTLGQWLLGVMYLVTKDEDLESGEYLTKLYTLDGLNISNLSSELKPIKYSQENLSISIQSNATEPTTLELYSLRMDVIGTEVPYPTLEELITNRVRRSGIVEELRGTLSNVEQKILPDRIVSTVTKSEVFASKFPTIINTSKSNLQWAPRLVSTYQSDLAQDLLNELDYDSNDIPNLPNDLSLVKVDHREFDSSSEDLISILTSRSDSYVPSELGYKIYTEIEIQSEVTGVPSGTYSLNSTYFNPVGKVIDSTYVDPEWVPGVLSLKFNKSDRVLSSVTYVNQSGQSIVARYYYYVVLEAVSELIPTSVTIPVNMSSTIDGRVSMINLQTPNGTSLFLEVDKDEVEIGVSPEMLIVEAYLIDASIRNWEIRFDGTSEWIKLDLTKFTTADYGLLPVEGSSQLPVPNYVGYKSVAVDKDIRYLTPELLKDPSWNSTKPRGDMSTYNKWYLRVVDNNDQVTSVLLTVEPDTNTIVKSLKEATAELVIKSDEIVGKVSSLEMFKTNTESFIVETESQLGILDGRITAEVSERESADSGIQESLTQLTLDVESIRLSVGTIKITKPWYAYSPNPDGSSMTLAPNLDSKYLGVYVGTDKPTSYTGYTWSRYRGTDGNDGTGIRSTEIVYQLHTDGTTAPTGNWTTTVPTPVKGKYLWTRTTIEYTNDTRSVSYSTSYYPTDGSQGIPGKDGIDGKTSYTHIAYADDITGNGFSQTPTGKSFIGMYVDFIETDSTDKTKYKWSKYVGEDGLDGEDGIPGKAGADGKTPYFHTAWANSQDGTVDFSTTVSAGKTHIGVYTDYVKDDSTTPSKYSWSLIKGTDGADGNGIVSTVVTYQLHINGTTAPTGTWSDTVPELEQGKYLWTRTVTTYTQSGPITTYSVSYIALDANMADLNVIANNMLTSDEKSFLIPPWSPYQGTEVEVIQVPEEVMNPDYGRNLLIGSGVEVTNSNYNISRYDLVNKDLTKDDTVTITIKGQLGSDRSSFRVYNSGGTSPAIALADKGNGIYQYTGKWVMPEITNLNTYLNVYQFSSSNTSESTIEWIKLEKGSVATPWVPAWEDIEDSEDTFTNYIRFKGGTSTVRMVLPMISRDNLVEGDSYGRRSDIRNVGSNRLRVSSNVSNSISPWILPNTSYKDDQEFTIAGGSTSDLQYSFLSDVGTDVEFYIRGPVIGKLIPLRDSVITTSETLSSRLDMTDSIIISEVSSLQETINENSTAISENTAAIKLESDRITSTVEAIGTMDSDLREYTRSEVKQSAEDLTTSFTTMYENVEGEVETIKSYISQSDAGILIGRSDSPIQLSLMNDRLSFIDKGVEFAYWEGENMVISNLIASTSIIIGTHSITSNVRTDSLGTTTLVKKEII